MSTVLPVAERVPTVTTSWAAAGMTARRAKTATANSVLRHCFGVMNGILRVSGRRTHVRRGAARAFGSGANEPHAGDSEDGGEHEQYEMRHRRNAWNDGNRAVDQRQPIVACALDRGGMSGLVRELRQRRIQRQRDDLSDRRSGRQGDRK